MQEASTSLLAIDEDEIETFTREYVDDPYPKPGRLPVMRAAPLM